MEGSSLEGRLKRIEALLALALARAAAGPAPGQGAFISVKDFGAVGDGVHNDAPNIDAARLALAGTGSCLWFPDGTWNVVAPVANAGAVPTLIGRGATFVGAGATSVTTATAGEVIYSENPTLLEPPGVVGTPATQLSQVAHESIGMLTAQFSGAGNGASGMGTISTLFNTTYDDVLHVGFNIGGAAPTKPQAHFSVEADFEQSPGQHCVEMHAQVFDPAFVPLGFNRPFSAQYWTGDGRMFTSLQYSDGGHGAGTGSLSIFEHSGNVQQVVWITGQMFLNPSNYSIEAADGLNIISNSQNGPITLRAGGGNLDNVIVDPSNHRTFFQQGGANILFVTVAKVEIDVPLDLEGQTTTNAAAAGGATALPATPLGYLSTTINGVAVKVPYYSP